MSLSDWNYARTIERTFSQDSFGWMVKNRIQQSIFVWPMVDDEPTEYVTSYEKETKRVSLESGQIQFGHC